MEDDIIIRAIKRGDNYFYAANYTGEHSTYKSYIQVYEDVNDQGEELLAMVVNLYQCKYNISEKHIVDLLEFTYDGRYFDYSNLMADFEVYYKKSSTETFKKVDTIHYLSESAHKGLYYNDDETHLLKILNNPVLNLGVNSVVKVEIKETLGSEGNIVVSDSEAVTFQMYRDATYAYAGIHVFINLLSDCVGGTDGDSIADTKHRLIMEKTMRRNITTEHDIITYINDIDANVQIVKKRNDIQDRNYFMYVLMRYDDRKLAPATTKRLNISGFRDALGAQFWGDFDRVEATVNRKIIRAYSKFELHVIEGEPDQDYVTKVPIDTVEEEGKFYLTCPYMILINELNIAYYYYTSVD
ncbi:MAG: hypothetical protein K2F99_06395, partial [Muribaculaceae bacterium]|nr:hypothetical protein [Muribaculaceae bacterium]